MNRTRKLGSMGTLLVVALISSAGQGAPPEEGANPLAGPRVQEHSTGKGLAARGFSGELQRLEVRPEVAALDALGLESAPRSGADKVLEEHAAAVSKLLLDETPLFLEIQNGRLGGASPEELRPLMRSFRAAAGDLLDPLVDKVAAALPEGKRAEYRGLVESYLGEMRKEREKAEGAAKGRAATGLIAKEFERTRDEANLLLREMARTLRGMVEMRREEGAAFAAAVELTPEQESQVQGIVRESAAQNNLRISPEQRRERLRKIMEVLTPEQREKAREYLSRK